MTELALSADFYLWIKALHIITVITFMAGMLYLPRLFVYHCETVAGSPESERFKIMERKLLRVIINPSLIGLWIFGLTLSFLPVTDAWSHPWFYAKFALALALSGLHGFFSSCVKTFQRDANTRSQRFYRIINEIPAVLMIGIVILVVVRPF